MKPFVILSIVAAVALIALLVYVVVNRRRAGYVKNADQTGTSED